jgi:hypothetical protein
MKVQLLTVCLLATLPRGARAQSMPAPEAPVATPAVAPVATPAVAPVATPAVAPVAPRPSRLNAQRQRLEDRRSTLDAQRQELEADIQQLESEAQRIDPEARLDSDQLFELLKDRERRRSSQTDPDPTPIAICISLFGSLLVGFLGWLVASNRKDHQLHQTVRMMVEKGAEIPSGLIAPPPRKPSDLRRGIILSTTGVGLAIFLAALPDARGAWGAGLTLFFLGVGHLLVWRLQRGRGPLSSELSPEPQP